jgi:hypothetical protein
MKNAPRKTFGVADLLERVNHFMTTSKPEQVAERRNEQHLMETILMRTNNYQGFGYLDLTANPNGMSPTIGDESRVFFYVSKTLAEDYNAAVAERVAGDGLR